VKRIPWVVTTLIVLSGCAPSTREQFKDVGGTWKPAAVTHVRVQMQALGAAANSGLLLPSISPNGTWIAYLEYHGDTPPAVDSLWTGKNLSGMSLHLRELAEDSPPRVVCASGAIWPTWSWNGETLLYVVYSNDGRGSLGLYDTADGKVRRFSVGCDGIMTPAFSPSGDAVAFIARARTSPQSRLYVLNLADRKLTPCPTVQQLGESHHWPTWTADGRIVFLRQSPGLSEVAHWKPGAFPPEALVPIAVPDTPMGRFQSFAGLGRPLSPNDQRFAYYDSLCDRIVLLHLQGQQRRVELKPGTRAGCWFDPARFVAATDKELRLFTDSENSCLLVRGSWLPRECIRNTNQLILCTRGAHRREFHVIRMQVQAVQ
jgi:hypothetical protein